MGKKGGGGGGTTTTTQTNAPPAYAAGALSNSVKYAQDLYNKNQNKSYFPGSTVSDLSPETLQALQQMQGLAGNNPIIDAGQRQATATINGDYLNSNNPYLQQVIDAASRDTTRNYQTAVMPAIDSQFAGSGRYGSGAFANAGDSARSNLGQALGDISSGIHYQDYSNERGYQNAAMNNAGALDAMKYLPSQMLASVGAARDQQNQAQLDDQVARYNYNRDAPTQSLNDFIAQITGAVGNYGTTTGTQTTPKPKSGGLLGALSGAAGLAGIFSGLGGSFSGISPFASSSGMFRS